MSYTDLLIVAYCCLSALLHLLEVGILDVVLRVVALSLLTTLEACAGLLVGTGLGTSLLVHLG